MSIEFEKAVLARLDRIDSRFDQIDSKLAKHDQILNEHSQSFNKISEELADMREIIVSNHNALILSEQEFHDKFGILFDSLTINNEAHNVYHKSIASLNAQIYNHDMRISHLEDLNQKKLANA